MTPRLVIGVGRTTRLWHLVTLGSRPGRVRAFCNPRIVGTLAAVSSRIPDERLAIQAARRDKPGSAEAVAMMVARSRWPLCRSCITRHIAWELEVFSHSAVTLPARGERRIESGVTP